jgi:very-short-patch-repair endonuclease
MQVRIKPGLTKTARLLRRKQTDAEKKLWQKLRSRQFEDSKFRRQQPMATYIVDFVSYEKQLVIELDGGQHNEKKVMEKDAEKTRWLERKGYRVLRFWDNEIMGNIEGVMEKISEFLK